MIEILIVVVLIGLLASMAIPAFKRVREESYLRAVLNDARQVAGAAQQLVTDDTTVVVVTIGVNTQTGVITGPLSEYVKKITRGTEVGDYDSSVQGLGSSFTMRNPYVLGGAVLGFDSEGKLL